MHGLAFRSDKEVALKLNVSIRIPTPEKLAEKTMEIFFSNL